jgi:hypothetical protein
MVEHHGPSEVWPLRADRQRGSPCRATTDSRGRDAGKFTRHAISAESVDARACRVGCLDAPSTVRAAASRHLRRRRARARDRVCQYWQSAPGPRHRTPARAQRPRRAGGLALAACTTAVRRERVAVCNRGHHRARTGPLGKSPSGGAPVHLACSDRSRPRGRLARPGVHGRDDGDDRSALRRRAGVSRDPRRTDRRKVAPWPARVTPHFRTA